MTPLSPSLRRLLPACLLLALFAAEFALFDQFGAKRHTAIYPRWNDQIQYLGEAYTAFERSRTGGFAVALEHTLTNPSAQGTLHDTFALIAFKLAGPSRSAALALNLLALIAWQAALFIAVTRRSGSPPLAFAAALLPLALAGPWENSPGSAYDFRLDHLAMCAIGVASAAALLTDGFRSRRASTAFGAAVALALVTRFLTGTYFAGLFAAMLAWILFGPEKKTRALHLGRAALVAAVLAGPFYWLNRERILDYYWVGHYVGPESTIRDQGFGALRSIQFVAGEFARRHVGLWFAVAAALGALVFARRSGERFAAARPAAVLGALFLLAPALVLAIHRQKSDVVLSALAPGAVLLTVALWLALARQGNPRRTWLAAAAVAGVIGLFFTQRQLRPAYDPTTLAHIRQVNTLADLIHARVTAGKLTAPRVAVDHVTDGLDAQVLRVICYERHRVWLPLDMTLPTGIAEPAETEVLSQLARSDFVFLTEEAPPGTYPFDRKLEAMRPQLRAWCETHLRATERFALFGRRMVLYQRREIPFAAPRP